MGNWVELEKYKYQEIWDRFYNNFDFKPSVHRNDWPTYKVKESYITYDISSIWNSTNFEEYEFKYKDLHQKILESFIKCTTENQIVYALDWMHTCYYFNPRLNFDCKLFEFADGNKILRWNIEVLPNGDYYIFLADDFRWGLLGHPWEKSICVFGKELIEEVNNNLPVVFDKVITSKL